jgi:hypothetical protein
MLKYLIPRFPLRDLPVMLGYALLGSVIAGTYGIIHDHITYSISREYFTHFKFDQFNWANLRLGSRGFVSCIGFLATWWVGLIVAWILARRMIPNQSRAIARRKILSGFGVVFAAVIVFGLLGYAYGIYRGPTGDYSSWEPALERLGVTDKWSFLRVAYIHNAGYLGGLVGLILTYFVIRPEKTVVGQQALRNVNT